MSGDPVAGAATAPGALPGTHVIFLKVWHHYSKDPGKERSSPRNPAAPSCRLTDPFWADQQGVSAHFVSGLIAV